MGSILNFYPTPHVFSVPRVELYHVLVHLPPCSAPSLCLLLLASSSVVPPYSTPLPLHRPPPQGFSGYHVSLVQTSLGFFQRANYRQLGVQRITFSVQGKAEARRQRVGLWITPALEWKLPDIFVLFGVVIVIFNNLLDFGVSHLKPL